MLMNHIEACIEEIERHPNALVILAGDVNQLSDNEIVERTGLLSIVKAPTRGNIKIESMFQKTFTKTLK